jgi:hypothetical protein
LATLRYIDASICIVVTFGLFRLAFLALLFLMMLYCVVMASARCIHTIAECVVDGLSALTTRIWQRLCYGSRVSQRKKGAYYQLRQDDIELSDLGSLFSNICTLWLTLNFQNLLPLREVTREKNWRFIE